MMLDNEQNGLSLPPSPARGVPLMSALRFNTKARGPSHSRTPVITCSYCAVDANCPPMVRHIDGKFICNTCGHISRPADENYVCHCGNCREIRRLTS
jgi:hypothetical protein